MPYTLGEAAKYTGLSKPTVQRAIKNGKLSALRNEDGSYSIDPAELERVYGPLPLASDAKGNVKQDETAKDSSPLQVELAVLREKLTSALSERERDRETYSQQIEDLRRRLDDEAAARRVEGEERRKLTAILTDQRQKLAPEPATTTPLPAPPVEAPPKGLRGWLHRLTG